MTLTYCLIHILTLLISLPSGTKAPLNSSSKKPQVPQDQGGPWENKRSRGCQKRYLHSLLTNDVGIMLEPSDKVTISVFTVGFSNYSPITCPLYAHKDTVISLHE